MIPVLSAFIGILALAWGLNVAALDGGTASLPANFSMPGFTPSDESYIDWNVGGSQGRGIVYAVTDNNHSSGCGVHLGAKNFELVGWLALCENRIHV